eukprot:TRINITY_DN18616_c0_g1_i1.p1 TRINITY_DN18616_c0_g1~~TRINITY_DN18616_c0_g1_i1.p1  ORF type:complete len:678 (-),score=233.73 TRINITY_DN18616_c0_g1_i1:157-2190(-)
MEAAPKPETAEAAPAENPIVPAVPPEVAQAEKAVQADCWDLNGWDVLLSHADKGPIEQVRECYERFLVLFPTAASYWKRYAQHEMAGEHYEQLWAIFTRCLVPCYSLELWRFYTGYMQEVKKEAPGEVIQAFEYALEHIGHDCRAAPLWGSYKDFLSAITATEPAATQMKRQALRKVQQRALWVPMHGVQSFWPDLEASENREAAQGNEGAKQLAKQILLQANGRLQVSLKILADLEPFHHGIVWDLIALPQGSAAGSQQLVLWRALLGYELQNVHALDAAQHKARCTQLFNQCLVCMRHYAEMWQLKADWLKPTDPSAAIEAYKEGCAVIAPGSQLLHLLLAQALERTGEDATQAYDDLLALQLPDMSCGWVHAIRYARRSSGVDGARKMFMQARKCRCAAAVIVEYATIEWLANSSPEVARKIFEVGLKEHIHDVDYVLAYHKFLQCTGDQRNLRALFNRAIAALGEAASTARAAPLWERQQAYEMQFGTLTEVNALQQRRTELGGAAHTMRDAVQLLRCGSAWPCVPEVLLDLETNQSAGTVQPVLPVQPAMTMPDLTKMKKYDLTNAAPVQQLTPAGSSTVPARTEQHTARAAPAQSSLPPAVHELLGQLPAPGLFRGMPVDVEALMKHLASYVPPAGEKRKAEEVAVARVELPASSTDLFHQRQRKKANTGQ